MKKLFYDYDYSNVEHFLDIVCEDICGGGCEITPIKENQFVLKKSNINYLIEIFELDDKLVVEYSDYQIM